LIERTRKNLAFIEEAHETGAGDVHVVTQLMLSLLGLIVFPVEGSFDREVEHLRLDELEKRGWPRWQFGPEGQSATLGHLLKRLRNAVAHRNMTFSSEGRSLESVSLEFWNQYKDKPPHWRARIEAKDLRAFCDRLIEFILMG
jgi:hypothetical protein